MDYHKIQNITVEDVVKAHMADLAIQEQYGVRYLQFWINEKAGTVFCLTEGPDARTCEMVHQMAHGNLACSITEVQTGTYQQIMGATHTDENGMTRNRDGIDLGYRTILFVTLRSSGHSETSSIDPLNAALKQASDLVISHHGRMVETPVVDGFIAVFNEAADAVNCSDHIRVRLTPLTREGEIAFRTGICAGQPVTEDGEFFTNTINLAQRLNCIADDNQILISSLARKLSGMRIPGSPQLKYLNDADEQFASDLLITTERNLPNSDYTIDRLCKDLGISRPQLYRKITALTGRAPNNFLRDLRLDKAALLLRRRAGNISEVALEVGFSNPSWFSKCFAERFGCIPSEIAHSQNV
ncbi:nickel-binding protein [Chryseolinea sp. T2]|uniref:nickel-binding protein n=1 Tax=Chryseolinea sp. T2 TaxID=3129255 RepID=UPI003076FA5E